MWNKHKISDSINEKYHEPRQYPKTKNPYICEMKIKKNQIDSTSSVNHIKKCQDIDLKYM